MDTLQLGFFIVLAVNKMIGIVEVGTLFFICLHISRPFIMGIHQVGNDQIG